MSRKIKDINPNYFYVVYDDDSYYVIKNVTSLCYVAYDHNCELVNTMNNWDAEHFINSNIKDGCKLKIFKDIFVVFFMFLHFIKLLASSFYLQTYHPLAISPL